MAARSRMECHQQHQQEDTATLVTKAASHVFTKVVVGDDPTCMTSITLES